MGNKSSLMLQDEEIKQISGETGFSHLQIEKLFSRFANLDRGNLGYLTRNDLMNIPELAINPLCDRLVQMFFAGCDPTDERINFRQFVRILATFRNGSNHQHHSLTRETSKTKIHKVVNPHNSHASRSNHRHHSSKDIPNLLKSSSFLNKCNTEENSFKIPKHETVSAVGLSSKLEFIFHIYDVDNDGQISLEDLRSILKMMVGSYIEEVQLDKIASRAFSEVDQDCDGFIDFDEFCQVFSGKDLDDKLRVKFF